MQGRHIQSLTENDKDSEFIKRLQLWKREKERNIFHTFPIFERCRPNNETEGQKKLLTNDFSGMQKQFSLYLKDVDDSQCEWARNPFCR
jgi:hypothetical protein